MRELVVFWNELSTTIFHWARCKLARQQINRSIFCCIDSVGKTMLVTTLVTILVTSCVIKPFDLWFVANNQFEIKEWTSIILMQFDELWCHSVNDMKTYVCPLNTALTSLHLTIQKSVKSFKLCYTKNTKKSSDRSI